MNERAGQFETLALPHLDAAYNLARWLLRNDHAAEDAVQEAFLRALRYFGSFDGRDGDAKPWLLGIVRNTCYTWLENNRGARSMLEFDDERDGHAGPDGYDGHDAPAAIATLPRDNPEDLLAQKELGARLDAAIEALPTAYREVVVLREFEELPYTAIARIAGIPIGTVMSRLSRARALLRASLLTEETQS